MQDPSFIRWVTNMLSDINERLAALSLLPSMSNQLINIERKIDQIMATQAEIAAELTDVKTELDKIQTETQTLLDLITQLQNQIANAQVSPELQAAADAVKTQAQVVDALVPDAPAP